MLERAPRFFWSPERCRQEYKEAWSIGKAVFEELIRLMSERRIELVEAEATAYHRAETAICNVFLTDHSVMRREGSHRARRVVKDMANEATIRAQKMRTKASRDSMLAEIMDADAEGLGGHGA
jgi:hypothetical protein